MIRRKLSVQLLLVLLAVSLVPLVGAGAVTLHLVEGSIEEQIRGSQEQVGEAAAATIRNFLDRGTTKLKTIARRVRPGEDPEVQARQLNTLIDPPDIFLEVGNWTNGQNPQVVAQVQQKDFNEAQSLKNTRNRAFNPVVGQFAYRPSDNFQLFEQSKAGQTFVASRLNEVEGIPSLSIAVPAATGNSITAELDLRPLPGLLASIAAGESRVLSLVDGEGGVLATSGTVPADAFSSRIPVGHADWNIAVHDPRAVALAPVGAARLQILLWFGLACVMAVVLAAVFAARIVRPVHALAATADALGRGDFATRTGIAREDEIGQLARAFDRMAAAVQELDRLKGEFVAHVSHELRTPLTSAKMALANVREGLAEPSSLGRVQEDLDRLIGMVNELLDVARIDAGITLAREATDLGALVRTSVDTLRPLARVDLSVEGDGETLDVDRARVQQIVVNLVDNALKHAKSRVAVAVAGREVRVTDDGPGVPPEARERIFGRFTRIESDTRPPGAGLGLSIARKLAELHGGTLTCDGNTFTLKL